MLKLPDFVPDAIVWTDFETYYWKGKYDLKKLGTEGYVRDLRFQTIGVGVAIDDGDPVWMESDDYRRWAATVDWDRVAVCSHHRHFDGLVDSHHYGIEAGMELCTLSMGRILHGTEVGGSLGKLATHYNAGEKGHEVVLANGKRREDFTPEEWLAYGEYCKNDVRLMRTIFKAMLAEGFPEGELWAISMTVQAFTRPRLRLDEPMLADFLVWERARKQALLDRIAKDKSVLMSNDKFAVLLTEMGVDPPRKISAAKSKKAGVPVETWAFAKSDPGMQELLEHEDDEVRWVAEARVGVKSTINETRAQRFLATATSGFAAPVYLKYAGAHTHRFSGADGRNWQNLQKENAKRPEVGTIRKSVMAPPGCKVVVVDSAQIEARGNGWFAGHDELVQAFAQKRDVYSEMASLVYKREVNRKFVAPDGSTPDKTAGDVGKMCLSGKTRVLTERRGWVPIVDVQLADRLWDGVEWVEHAGVIEQGRKTTWEAHGLAATADHEVLTGSGWREWSEVRTSPSLLRSALALARSSWSSGVAASMRGPGGPAAGTPWSAATAAGKGSSSGSIFCEGARPGAMPARRWLQGRSGGGSTGASSPTMPIGRDCSTAWRPASLAARIRATAGMFTTGLAEFASTLSGVRTALSSSGTFSPCPAGMSPSWSWTALTWTGTTSRGTSASSRARSTRRTSGRSLTLSSGSASFCAPSASSRGSTTSCSRSEMTYDVASAGPRSRFTVWTDLGPVLVHNCVLGLGYGMGWYKAAMTLAAGPLGADPIVFGMEDAERMGVDVARFTRSERKMARVERMPSRLPLEERVVHCAVAEHIVRTYRDTNQPIVDLWAMCDEALEVMLDGDGSVGMGPGNLIGIERHALRVPSGLALRYPGLGVRVRVDEETGEERKSYGFLGANHGKAWKPVYGGLITENIVQHLARQVMVEQMVAMKAEGMWVASTTHDEVLLIEDERYAEGTLKRALEIMRTPPAWAAGWPLNAEGDLADRYGDAK